MITRKMTNMELCHVINKYILEDLTIMLLEGSVYYLGIFHLTTSLSIRFCVLIKNKHPFYICDPSCKKGAYGFH